MKVINDFLKSIKNGKYYEAKKQLQSIIENKLKNKIKEVAKNERYTC